MKFTLLRLSDFGEYWPNQRDEYNSLGILLYFLNHDVGDESGAASFTDWTLNANEGEYTSSNVSFVRKKHGKIIIRDLFTMGEEDQPFCEIRLQNFLNILDKWAEICKKEPPRIVMIDKGNGDIYLEDVL